MRPSINIAVNSTANGPNGTSLVFTGAALDGAAQGDYIEMRLRRIAASASEMAGDANLAQVQLTWV